MIRAILACDEDWGIGKSGTLPWPHNPADLKWFKENTTNGIVVMGRSTWDSLPYKPLPNRENVVITHHDVPDAHIVGDLKSISKLLPQMSQTRDVWIIGGASIITQLLPRIDELWLSQITGSYKCDTFLPSTLIQENYNLTSSQFQGDVYVDIWSKH